MPIKRIESTERESPKKLKTSESEPNKIFPNITLTPIIQPQTRIFRKVYRFDDIDSSHHEVSTTSLALPTREPKINNFSMRSLDLMKKLKADKNLLKKNLSIKIIEKISSGSLGLKSKRQKATKN